MRDGNASVTVRAAALPSAPLDAGTDVVDDSAGGGEPAQVVESLTLARAVRRWIDDDLPPHLASRLRRWWETTGARTTLPAQLAVALRPYLFRLAPAAGLLD